MEKNVMDEIIFEIGDLIHVRYKGKFLIFGRKLLTPDEIIESQEFIHEFQKPYPMLSKFILESYYKEKMVKDVTI